MRIQLLVLCPEIGFGNPGDRVAETETRNSPVEIEPPRKSRFCKNLVFPVGLEPL
ncbi:unnamed protein product [Tuwongella immobilis]|uniref:Uncharacterized protein n=1 Tax=Tuwongella immobilis TaxID=692036 RepID=A0A6C2YP83_9BACT|nr:unnamed protein product [Tuwongella immobilis]VTS03618.1 unnamed protein product [Tuwongella immobilis]